MRQRFRETLEGLAAARMAARGARRAEDVAGVAAGLGEPLSFGPIDFTRDRPAETILRSLAFRPMRSGKGKWHVAYADNRYVQRPAGLEAPDTRPSCGSRGRARPLSQACPAQARFAAR